VLPRFHVPDLDPAAARVALPPDEAHHLAHVLRLGAGDEVEIFDGRGSLWRAKVVEAGKRGVAVAPLRPALPAREARVRMVLAVAVLKGQKMDAVVRDAVMLGAAAIQPLVTARTDVSLSALRRGDRVERWRRIAVASVKQCGRAVVPTVHEPLAFRHYLSLAGAGTRIMCVEPSVADWVPPIGEIPDEMPASADVLVGPEGGWTIEEVTAASEAGVLLASLGSRTLRADAVPLVALTALLARWGEL
jgi:16S rRNA (uracil1498-N3)-methyltransferase